MSRTILLSSVVALSLASVAVAEPLDEASYMKRAVAADPRPRLAAVDEVEARAEELERGLRANPELTVDREHLLGDRGDLQHIIALDVPLDLSGRRGKRVDAARARGSAARARREATEIDVALDAMLAYREASHRRARAALLVAGHPELERAVDIVRARVRAGDAPELELERAELELVLHHDDIARAELDRDAAERALGSRIGVASVEATGDIPLPPSPPPEANLLTRAAARPELSALRHLDRVADAERAAAARAWMPELVVSGGAKSVSAGDETRWGYVLGLGLEVPIFGRGSAARARASVERERVRALDTGLSERTSARIAAARAQLERRREVAERNGAARAERVARVIKASEAAYREGGPLVELLDAYRMRQRTLLAALDLRHDARVAELELWRAIGRLP